MPAGIFPGKRLSKHTQTVGTCQSKWLCLFFTKPDTVHPLWSFKTRHKQQQGTGGFFGLVAIETIVLPSSFLPRIPPHNAMKSKLPFFDKADWSGVWKRQGWRPHRAKDARGPRENHNIKQCPPKGQARLQPLLPHWSFCFLTAVCYLISGRLILSVAPSSAKPDSGLFKEWRNNKHPLRLDVRHSTKPQSIEVLLPPR